MKNLLYIFLLCLPAFANAQLWQPLDEGVICDDMLGPTHAITNIYYDPQLNIIDVIGYFMYTNECEENRGFTFWDGENWNSYPSSCNIPPHSLLTFQEEKYSMGGIVCGTTNNNLYKLVDNNWTLINTIPNTYGYSLLKEIDNRMYIGTSLQEDENGDIPALLEYNINNEDYSVIAKKSTFNLVNFEELLVFNDSLFMGGKFNCNPPWQPDNRINNLAKIQGDTLVKVGQGLNPNSHTYSMCVHRDTLFIGGIFGSENFPGFTNAPYVFLIYYHNGQLKPYPIQANAYISTMVSHDDVLYLGGWFTEIGNEMCYGVGAIIDNEVISLNTDQLLNPYGYEIEAFAHAINKLLVVDDHLYMAGRFDYIGDDGPYGNIAKLSTSLSEFSKVVEDKLNWEMKLYPNPADEYITLEIPLGAQGTLQIFNNLGQLVHQEYISQVKTDIFISNLNSGAYHCVFKTPNNTTSERIIIQ
ncbi:MAG: T9SS type A sorting domain-containing protein [Flavobacteriales bacterium]|jgi:hypothetical protein